MYPFVGMTKKSVCTQSYPRLVEMYFLNQPTNKTFLERKFKKPPKAILGKLNRFIR